jgi:hypothetical protein
MSDDKFTPKGEEEIKAEVIEKYGLDAETQGETIDKITADNLESQKNLGTAIRQKGEWRDKANANTPPEPTGGEGGEKPVAIPTTPEGTQPKKPSEDRSTREIAADVKAITGKSDDVVNAAERIAKIDGITLAEAMKDPTVVALEEKLDREKTSQKKTI